MLFENLSQTHNKRSVNCTRKENIMTCLTGGVSQRSWKCRAGHDSLCYCWCLAGVKEECRTWMKEKEEGQTAALTFGFRICETCSKPMLAGFYHGRIPGSRRLFPFLGDAASLTYKTYSVATLKESVYLPPHCYLLLLHAFKFILFARQIIKCIFYEQ